MKKIIIVTLVSIVVTVALTSPAVLAAVSFPNSTEFEPGNTVRAILKFEKG
jgi:hypothetical protein